MRVLSESAAADESKDLYSDPRKGFRPESVDIGGLLPDRAGSGGVESVAFPRHRYNGSMTDSPQQHMPCMDGWGGSQGTSSGVEPARPPPRGASQTLRPT